LAILIFIHSPRAGNCGPNIFVFIFLVGLASCLPYCSRKAKRVILTSITIQLWKEIYNSLSIGEPLNLSLYKEGFRANIDINTSLQASFCNLKASPEHLATLSSSEHVSNFTAKLNLYIRTDWICAISVYIRLVKKQDSDTTTTTNLLSGTGMPTHEKRNYLPLSCGF
jgi:hypothetical protein